jgi:hypothetical protein
MSIVAARIDNSLLHGIVATQWTPQYRPQYRPQRVMVIDDEYANDPTKKAGMKMAKPAGCPFTARLMLLPVGCHSSGAGGSGFLMKSRQEVRANRHKTRIVMIDVSFSIFFISFPFFHRCVGECYFTVELYTKAPFIASVPRHNRRFTQAYLLNLTKEKAASGRA